MKKVMPGKLVGQDVYVEVEVEVEDQTAPTEEVSKQLDEQFQLIAENMVEDLTVEYLHNYCPDVDYEIYDDIVEHMCVEDFASVLDGWSEFTEHMSAAIANGDFLSAVKHWAEECSHKDKYFKVTVAISGTTTVYVKAEDEDAAWNYVRDKDHYDLYNLYTEYEDLDYEVDYAEETTPDDAGRREEDFEDAT